MTDEKASKQIADTIIWRAMALMAEEGVPFPVMIDRMVTAAGAHVVRHEGPSAATKLFHGAAQAVENGVFASLERKPASH